MSDENEKRFRENEEHFRSAREEFEKARERYHEARHQEREALKDLVLPERMGDRFRVLVLGAGEVTRDLRGLSEPWTGNPGAVHAGPAAPGRGVDGTAGHEVA